MEQHKVAQPLGYFTLELPQELLDLVVKEVESIEYASYQEAQLGTLDNPVIEMETRNSKVHWWYEQHWVSSLFCHYFNKANRDIWEYDLTYLQGIQVTKYDVNDKYDWHSDYGTEIDNNHTRKLSASLLVTDESEYEGGDFEFIDYHGKTITAPKKKGTIILFDSRIPHRVTPVTKGTRTSLVAWMLGPKLR